MIDPVRSLPARRRIQVSVGLILAVLALVLATFALRGAIGL